MNFQTTIGLEVHVELKTNSKIYSPSPVEYGDQPNANKLMSLTGVTLVYYQA